MFFTSHVKKTAAMVGQGMGDLLSIFNERSLKKERLDTAREGHTTFRKLCESPAIG